MHMGFKTMGVRFMPAKAGRWELEGDMNLPNSFTKVIERYGIGKEEIVFAALADLDDQFRFADSVVAVTGKKLIVARYPYREKQEYRLGG